MPLKDPICGMDVEPATALNAVGMDGETYFFCSQHCLNKFRSRGASAFGSGMEPAAPVLIGIGRPASGALRPPLATMQPARAAGPTPSTSPASSPPPGAARKYTCPMHPEIVKDGPGSCPICGMALEPVEVSVEEEKNPELEDMTRRFWIAVALTAPVFVLGMLERLPWVQLVLATPVVLWCGLPFFQRGRDSIVARSPNMFTLIAMGTGTAYLYSLVATAAPGLFPHSFRDHDGSVGVYFEAAAVITVLVLLGQVLELRARSRTSAAIRALLGLAPKTSRRIRADGADEDVPTSEIRPGDRLRIRPGEKIPVD